MPSGLDYFCIDIESSGPIPGIHNLLSLGAVQVRRHGGRYSTIDELYLEVRPVFPGFEEPAMRIHGLDRERLEREGLDPMIAMRTLHDWVRGQQANSKDRPVFVAHNAPFDWMFCAWYFGHTGVPNPFGHSALDTKALAMGQLKISWVETSLKNVASLLGMRLRDSGTLHHAGDDARYQALVFCELMNLAKS